MSILGYIVTSRLLFILFKLMILVGKQHSISNQLYDILISPLFIPAAVTDLGKGERCDEKREQRYCAPGLVCYNCGGGTNYQCVRCKYFSL